MYPPYLPRPTVPPPPTPPLLVLPRPGVAAWHDVWIVEGTIISADPAVVGVLSQYLNPWTRRPELDQTWYDPDTFEDDDEDDDGDNEEELGFITAEPALIGSWLQNTFFSPIISASPSLVGTWAEGVGVSTSYSVIAGNAELLSGYITSQASAAPGEAIGANWLRWSKIGVADFTIGRSNEAGQMPMPWQGSVWQIAQRGKQIIVYGENGVALLNSSGVTYGHSTVLKVGLKNKLAFCDIGEAHYFIDSFSRLWKWGEGPQLLDYREWLATLTNPILAFDPNTRLLYICDGTNGYVYNVDTGSMGKGPATYTGIQQIGGTLYVTKSGAVSVANFAITTDILAVGPRKATTVRYVEANVDTTLTLQGSLDYRLEKHSSFLSTDWYPFDLRGHCWLNTYGYEFRVKVRATSGGWFHLDRLAVYGDSHAH